MYTPALYILICLRNFNKVSLHNSPVLRLVISLKECMSVAYSVSSDTELCKLPSPAGSGIGPCGSGDAGTGIFLNCLCEAYWGPSEKFCVNLPTVTRDQTNVNHLLDNTNDVWWDFYCQDAHSEHLRRWTRTFIRTSLTQPADAMNARLHNQSHPWRTSCTPYLPPTPFSHLLWSLCSSSFLCSVHSGHV